MNVLHRDRLEPRPLHRDAATILRDGFVEESISPTFLQPRITAIHAGMRLLTQDSSLASRFPWQVFASDAYGADYNQEVGFEFKDDDEKKSKFQYASGAFADVIESGRVEALREFFRALDDLDRAAKQLALRYAQSFDSYAERHGIEYGAPLVEKLIGGVCVTRLLCYPPGKHTVRRAKTHVDRCFLTPHWWGSHRGLKLHSRGAWQGVDETALDKIAIFPGEKFAACTHGAFGTYGTPHGVWCDEDLLEDRYAVVSFVHPRANAADCAWLREHARHIKEFEAQLFV